jgi:hypothetical protein
MLDISSLAKQLLASEEGDCSMELFSSMKGRKLGLGVLSSVKLTTK